MKGISEFISKLLRTSGKRRSHETNLPCRRFSLAEIKTATNNFDDNLFIGEDRYGKKVYKGFIDDRTISVAVKHTDLWPGKNEVLLLCQLHLKRVHIKRWPGLSKASIQMEFGAEAGTLGYIAPEIFLRGQFSNKSGVYSFGMVLFEVICARNVFESSVEREEEMYLPNWAQKCKEEGTINQIIDPHLTGKIAPECLNIYVDIATSCVQIEEKDRPTMVEVEVGLEHALELQESADVASKDVDPVCDQKCTTSTDLSLDTTTPNGK